MQLKRWHAIVSCTLLILSISTPMVSANELEELTATSRKLIAQFADQLKSELSHALQDGGPLNAIAMCKLKTPEIALANSIDGWIIRRTSLKTRNPQNAPDDFELKILKEFEEKKLAGQDINQLAYYKMTEVGNQSEFRYIKAIPVGEICLQCHGQDLSTQLINQLDTQYPEDKARNFKLGDIRGAFTLRKKFLRDVPELDLVPSADTFN